MPIVRISGTSMALLIAEARARETTVKDVADWCIAEALEEEEGPEEEPDEEGGE